MQKMIMICAVTFGGVVMYKRRYKIVNMLLAVSIIRKLMITVTMRIPILRGYLMPSIFEGKR